jgi:hypothetical protein
MLSPISPRHRDGNDRETLPDIEHISNIKLIEPLEIKWAEA